MNYMIMPDGSIKRTDTRKQLRDAISDANDYVAEQHGDILSTEPAPRSEARHH